jgi:hypothetical protein
MDNEVKNVVESATADGTRPDGSGAADGRSGAEADGEEEGMSLADIYSEKTKHESSAREDQQPKSARTSSFNRAILRHALGTSEAL